MLGLVVHEKSLITSGPGHYNSQLCKYGNSAGEHDVIYVPEKIMLTEATASVNITFPGAYHIMPISCIMSFFFHEMIASSVKFSFFFSIFLLSLCLLVSCDDNLCKQFEPRSGPTKRRA